MWLITSLFGLGLVLRLGVWVFWLAGLSVDKIVEVNRVNDRLMFLKILIGELIITIVSAYAPQQGLAEIDINKFYELLVSSLSRLSENEVVFLGGDLNGHVGRFSDGYEVVHGGFGYGTRNQKG